MADFSFVLPFLIFASLILFLMILPYLVALAVQTAPVDSIYRDARVSPAVTYVDNDNNGSVDLRCSGTPKNYFCRYIVESNDPRLKARKSSDKFTKYVARNSPDGRKIQSDFEEAVSAHISGGRNVTRVGVSFSRPLKGD